MQMLHRVCVCGSYTVIVTRLGQIKCVVTVHGSHFGKSMCESSMLSIF